MVASRTGGGFAKITPSRVSPVAGGRGRAGVHSAPICREFLVGGGQSGAHRREWFHLRGNDRRPRFTRVFAGANFEGNANSVERNGKGVVAPASCSLSRGRPALSTAALL